MSKYNMCEYCMENFYSEIIATINEIYNSYSEYVEQDDFDQEVMLTLCEIPRKVLTYDREDAANYIKDKLNTRLVKYCDKCSKYYSIDKTPEFELSDRILDSIDSKVTLIQLLKNADLSDIEKSVLYMYYAGRRTFEEIGYIYDKSATWADRLHKKTLFRIYLAARRRNITY